MQLHAKFGVHQSAVFDTVPHLEQVAGYLVISLEIACVSAQSPGAVGARPYTGKRCQ